MTDLEYTTKHDQVVTRQERLIFECRFKKRLPIEVLFETQAQMCMA